LLLFFFKDYCLYLCRIIILRPPRREVLFLPFPTLRGRWHHLWWAQRKTWQPEPHAVSCKFYISISKKLSFYFISFLLGKWNRNWYSWLLWYHLTIMDREGTQVGKFREHLKANKISYTDIFVMKCAFLREKITAL